MLTIWLCKGGGKLGVSTIIDVRGVGCRLGGSGRGPRDRFKVKELSIGLCCWFRWFKSSNAASWASANLLRLVRGFAAADSSRGLRGEFSFWPTKLPQSNVRSIAAR